MKLIANHTRLNHKEVITQLIKESNEIIICVAFLKSSGLDLILNVLKTKTAKCIFYIGTDYYLTEPNAIRKLLNQGHPIFRIRKSNSTFHPKIYYFKNMKGVTILTGSANLTGGGFETNFEASFLIETTNTSNINKEFRSIINDYAKSSTDFGDELLISKYEADYEKYKQKHQKADKEFRDEKKKAYEFDLSEIPKYLARYNSEKGAAERFDYRTEQYKIAKKLLTKITIVKIASPKDFLDYYDQIATSYYSSGLLRGKRTMAKKYKSILSVIKIVQQNKNASPKYLFEKTLPFVKSINRFGINALTELMNTYNPKKYSVANGRTLKSLAKLRFPVFPSPNNFDAETYEKYNNLITAIAIKCKFENLGHVDHFLSWIYSKYVKKKSTK